MQASFAFARQDGIASIGLTPQPFHLVPMASSTMVVKHMMCELLGDRYASQETPNLSLSHCFYPQPVLL